MITVGLYIIGGAVLTSFFTLFYLEDKNK